MSVANVAYLDNEIWMISDTMTYGADGTPIRLCERKTEIAPSGRFAWTTRGSVAVADMWDAVARLRQTMDEAETALLDWAEAMPSEDLAPFQRGRQSVAEVTVAGWSDRIGDLVVYRVHLHANRPEPIVEMLERGIHIRPGSDWSERLPKTLTRKQFLQLAWAQWQLQDDRQEPMCIGGVAHWTTCTRTGCTQEIAGLYGDYHQHAARFGDPNADAVSRFLGERKVMAA